MHIKNTFLKDFIAHVQDKPAMIALQSSEQSWTYEELHDEVIRQSALIKKAGVKNGDVVAVICTDKVENTINCLAVVMAGGVFLAIDNNIPKERFRHIKNDSKMQYAISQKPIEWLGDLKVIDLRGEVTEEILNESNSYGENMYMLYTSGTTGNPKAVIIHYEAFKLFRDSINKVIEYDKRNVVFLATTSLTFDISILETLVTLSYGGSVVCVDDDKKMIPMHVKEVIQNSAVNTVQFTPTYIQFLMKHFNNDLFFLKNVEKILVGGEIFTNEIKNCLLQLTNSEVYNCYGPTETTIWATVEKISQAEEIFIGYPLDGYEVFIEGKEEIGEINIRGEAVAKGYFNQEELSSEKFYISGGKRTYRTGDLGRISDDGRLIFCGRKDRQVKIKGFRVELDEIESVITRTCREIYKAAVIFSEGKLICIYQSDFDISRKDFISILKEYLPSYMVPMYYCRVEEFPILTNGKTDYQKLRRNCAEGL